MIRRWRWRLARLIAPVPIIEDRLAGEDGAFVVLRQDGTLMTFRADRFRMRSRSHIPKAWLDPNARVYGDFSRHFTTTHFSGTVAR